MPLPSDRDVGPEPSRLQTSEHNLIIVNGYMPWRLTIELVIGVQLQVLSESVVLGVAATVSFTLASSKRMHMKKCLWWLQTQKLFFLPAKAALI